MSKSESDHYHVFDPATGETIATFPYYGEEMKAFLCNYPQLSWVNTTTIPQTRTQFCPEGLDLGNINFVRPGEQIAVVRIRAGRVRVVGLASVKANEGFRVRTNRGDWWTINEGCAAGHFYSANPRHVKAALLKKQRAGQQRARREARDRASLEAFCTELSTLMAKYNVTLDTHYVEEGSFNSSVGGIYASCGNQTMDLP